MLAMRKGGATMNEEIDQQIESLVQRISVAETGTEILELQTKISVLKELQV